MLLLLVSGADFLSILAPGIDPGAQLGGEGVAGDGQDLAGRAFAQGLDFISLGIIDVDPRAVLHDKDRGAIAFQLPNVSAEGLDLLAVLIIDVVPALGGLDIADALRPKTSRREQQHK